MVVGVAVIGSLLGVIALHGMSLLGSHTQLMPESLVL